jgi:cob(I)alamin adenosyltransferase
MVPFFQLPTSVFRYNFESSNRPNLEPLQQMLQSLAPLLSRRANQTGGFNLFTRSFVTTSLKKAKKIKIYTKTGDGGTSQLYNGERRPKDIITFHALGDTDELNSHVGVALQHESLAMSTLEPQLEQIQSRLLDVGSAIATPLSKSGEAKINRVSFPEGEVEKLESWIDDLDSELPPLASFILPSGGPASAQLHLARTVCRRAERSVVVIQQEGDVEHSVLKYLNRLSDYLFTAARYASMKDGKEEVIYKKNF